MTPEQRLAWFTYHPPTDETAPKYAAIRQAAEKAEQTLGIAAVYTYDQVTAAALGLADAIEANCPLCADASAAIRCVRLARNAANEAIRLAEEQASDALAAIATPIEDRSPRIRGLLRLASDEVIKARWQANSAIACGGI